MLSAFQRVDLLLLSDRRRNLYRTGGCDRTDGGEVSSGREVRGDDCSMHGSPMNIRALSDRCLVVENG